MEILDLEEQKFDFLEKRESYIQDKKETLTLDDFEMIAKICQSRLSELRLQQKRFNSPQKEEEAVLKQMKELRDYITELIDDSLVYCQQNGQTKNPQEYLNGPIDELFEPQSNLERYLADLSDQMLYIQNEVKEINSKMDPLLQHVKNQQDDQINSNSSPFMLASARALRNKSPHSVSIFQDGVVDKASISESILSELSKGDMINKDSTQSEDAELDSKFKHFCDIAVRYNQNILHSISMDQNLDLYGLYKQATEGNNYKLRPGGFHIKQRKKWAAWMAKKNMPKKQAQQQYINLMNQIMDKLGLYESDDEKMDFNQNPISKKENMLILSELMPQDKTKIKLSQKNTKFVAYYNDLIFLQELNQDIEVYDSKTKKLKDRLDVKKHQISSFCSIEEKLFFGSINEIIFMWDHKNKKKQAYQTKISNDILQQCLVGNSLIAVSTNNPQIKFFSLADFKLEYQEEIKDQAVAQQFQVLDMVQVILKDELYLVFGTCNGLQIQKTDFSQNLKKVTKIDKVSTQLQGKYVNSVCMVPSDGPDNFQLACAAWGEFSQIHIITCNGQHTYSVTIQLNVLVKLILNISVLPNFYFQDNTIFIRHQDGLCIYDMKENQIVKTIDKSKHLTFYRGASVPLIYIEDQKSFILRVDDGEVREISAVEYDKPKDN
ncbi:acyl--binding protein [Stylonychia lemnae]|uniref:Acyl--binding protein n=1 Tax=Stylonychia lemnae TaxID=5949 RepID=A0A078B502_STYLE|nr:acyl--binding protein [Stylonychia lemnae]|eukprot:CDW89326.1 acyl--binding protein [Stylonychia lemnae]